TEVVECMVYDFSGLRVHSRTSSHPFQNLRLIFMKSPKTLILSGCSKLKKFPEIVGNMKFLRQLLLDGTDIKGLLLSIVLLSGIVQLNLKGCKNIECLPNFISALKFPSTLNFSGLLKFRLFPEIMGCIEHLLALRLLGTAIRGLP
ncbi:hypothetical protein CISIN_1g0383902mg, partial [Citrus sinensis]